MSENAKYHKDEAGVKADIRNEGDAQVPAELDAGAPGREELLQRPAVAISSAKPMPTPFGATASGYHNTSAGSINIESQIGQASTDEQRSICGRACPDDGKDPLWQSMATEPQPAFVQQSYAHDGTWVNVDRAASAQLAEELARRVCFSHQTGSSSADSGGKGDASSASLKKISDRDREGEEDTAPKRTSPSSGSPCYLGWPQAV